MDKGALFHARETRAFLRVAPGSFSRLVGIDYVFLQRVSYSHRSRRTSRVLLSVTYNILNRRVQHSTAQHDRLFQVQEPPYEHSMAHSFIWIEAQFQCLFNHFGFF